MEKTSRARRATAITAAAVAVVGTVAATTVQPAAAFAAAAAERAFLAAVPAVPVISSVSPPVGSVTGGKPVVLLGSNFRSIDRDDPNAVLFGTVPAGEVIVLSDTKLVAVPPPRAVGDVLIKVTNATGASKTTTSRYGYRLELGAAFDSVAAKATGGDQITVGVTGGGAGDSATAFNSLKISAAVGGVAARVAWVDADHVQVTVPATAKAVPSTLRLTQNGFAGPESASTVDYFPVVSAINPRFVGAAGGELVKVTGAGFLALDPEEPGSVTIDGVPAPSFTVVSGTALIVETPAGSSGSHAAVRVHTPDVSSPAENAPRLLYQGELAVDTSGGQFLRASGGAHVLAVTGGTVGTSAKDFTALRIEVRLGTVKLPAVWVDETHLRVTIPVLTATSADLTMLNGTMVGPAVTLPAAPVVTSLSQATDTIAGGRKVTIRVAGADTATATDFLFGANDAECTSTGAGNTLLFTCTVPPATDAGPVWVRFTSGAGTPSGFTAAAMFSYTDLE
jgi:hypothetical protein